jgi:hypothetical protein
MSICYGRAYYDERENGSSPGDRAPFDAAYRCLADVALETLGPAARTGRYEYAHRPGWPYSYCLWRLDEAQVILLQDEHDIQFGMDVSLWLFPPGRVQRGRNEESSKGTEESSKGTEESSKGTE